MALDLSVFADYICAFIEELPTEATFRGQVITVRVGEAPKTREMLIAGFQSSQATEVLLKAEDAGEDEPTAGETITIDGTGYKVGTVTPLVSLTCPAGYRLTITRLL